MFRIVEKKVSAINDTWNIIHPFRSWDFPFSTRTDEKGIKNCRQFLQSYPFRLTMITINWDSLIFISIFPDIFQDPIIDCVELGSFFPTNPERRRLYIVSYTEIHLLRSIAKLNTSIRSPRPVQKNAAAISYHYSTPRYSTFTNAWNHSFYRSRKYYNIIIIIIIIIAISSKRRGC